MTNLFAQFFPEKNVNLTEQMEIFFREINVNNSMNIVSIEQIVPMFDGSVIVYYTINIPCK